jgi:hypothetical protein
VKFRDEIELSFFSARLEGEERRDEAAPNSKRAARSIAQTTQATTITLATPLLHPQRTRASNRVESVLSFSRLVVVVARRQKKRTRRRGGVAFVFFRQVQTTSTPAPHQGKQHQQQKHQHQ